ncbi:hypothetical protein JCM15519_30800 [Fundidesulfovibrio butyratiphilus]
MPVLAPLAFSHFDWRNPDLSPDKTCAPPLESLTPADKALYAAKSPYNIVHADQPHAPRAAARLIGAWRDQGALIKRQPAYYLMRSHFPDPADPDRPLVRWSVFGGLRVGSPGVLPLETAGPQDVAIRLAALREAKAQLSPIFALFDLPDVHLANMGREVQGLLQPLAVLRDNDAVHRLWRLPARHESDLGRALAGAEVIVVSGTEFFEAARIHREEQGGGEFYPWDFACACLASVSEPGLVVQARPVLIGPHSKVDFSFALQAATERFDILPMEDLSELHACPDQGAFALEHKGVLHLLRPKSKPDLAPVRQVLDALSQRQALCVFWRRYLRLGGHHTPKTADDPTQARLAQAEERAQAALYPKPPTPRTLVLAARLGVTLPPGTVRLAAAPPAGLVTHLPR